MMKIHVLFLFILGCMTADAAPVHFFEGTYEELRAEAKRTQKHIFIDFYTDWCRPCLLMQQYTFSQDSVGDFINEYFIAYKVNCEKDTALKRKYQVPTYPHWVFTTPEKENEVLYAYTGYVDWAYFLRAAQRSIGYTPARFAHLQNPKDVPLFQTYLAELSHSYPDSARKEAEAFILKNANFAHPLHWHIIQEYIKEFESPVFRQVVAQSDVLFPKYPEVKKYIHAILDEEKAKVLRKKNLSGWIILKEMYWTAGKNCKLFQLPLSEGGIAQEKAYFLKELEMEWALSQREEATFMLLGDELLASKYAVSLAKHNEFALKVAKHFKHTESLDLAEKWVQKALEWDKINGQTYYTWSFLRFRKSDYAKALLLIEKAEKFALSPQEKDAVLELKRKIQARN